MPFKKNNKIAHRIIRGEAFLLDTSAQTLHCLNPAGARIWELIDGRRGEKQIAGIIFDEFETDAASVSADVGNFLAELSAKGLISE